MKTNYLRELYPIYVQYPIEKLVDTYNDLIFKKPNNKVEENNNCIHLAMVKFVLISRDLNYRNIIQTEEFDYIKRRGWIDYVSCFGEEINDALKLMTTDFIRLDGKCLVIGAPPLPKRSTDKSRPRNFLFNLQDELKTHEGLSKHQFKISDRTDNAYLFIELDLFDLVTPGELTKETNDSRIPVFQSDHVLEQYYFSELNEEKKGLVAVIVFNKKLRYTFRVFKANGQILSNKVYDY